LFVAALVKELESRRMFLPKGSIIKTIYMGGGTPSILSPKQFMSIFTALSQQYDLSSVEEFTIEVNPDDICSKYSEGLLEAFKTCGVNRVSIGIQSFCDEHLNWMNRRHSAAQAEQALHLLRSLFDNISLDLIFGFPLLSHEQWKNNLEKAVASGVQHISAYQLSVDPESVLAQQSKDGHFLECDEDICRTQYEFMQNYLVSKGFDQYEISNFCKKGFHSRHNSSYWTREPYLGLGPGAHSFDGSRLRCWNEPDLANYLERAEPECEMLSDVDIYNEKVMLGLRTSAGIDAELLRGAVVHNLSYDPAKNRYYIAKQDLFISDSIILDYLQ